MLNITLNNNKNGSLYFGTNRKQAVYDEVINSALDGIATKAGNYHPSNYYHRRPDEKADTIKYWLKNHPETKIPIARFMVKEIRNNAKQTAALLQKTTSLLEKNINDENAAQIATALLDITV